MRSAKTESDLIKIIQLLATENGGRLLRNNNGVGWVGKLINREEGLITLTNYRPLNAGLCNGSGDLIGWTPLIITEKMIGKKVAIFTSIEGKNPKKSKISVDQLLWNECVNDAGGISQIVKSEADYLKAIGRLIS